jgi:hypothetical protein
MKKHIKILFSVALMNLAFTFNLVAQQCTQCTNTTTGTDASAIGQNTNATGFASFASGYEVQSIGDFAFGHGKFITVGGANSLVLGKYAETQTSPAMIIGYGASNTQRLINSVPNSLMIGLNSNKPTLFVGPSLGIGTTGKIGIGNVTDPQAKLHIKADNTDTASVFIEPFSTSKSAFLYLGTKTYGLKYYPNRLEFLSGDKFVFYSGNIGIGTYTPTERLEIAGNLKQQAGYRIETEKVMSTSTKGLQLYNSSSKGIVIDNSGNIGINTSKPTTNLQVNGKILTTYLQIPDPAPDDSSKSITGYVLRSYDAEGNASWTAQSNLDDGDWTKSGDNVYRLNGNVGIGTNPTSNKLSVIGNIDATSFSGDGTDLTNVPGDNLGDHIARQNIQLTGKWLSGDGGNEGIFINSDGNVGIGTDTPSGLLSLYKNNPAENFGISFQNGSSTKYWIGHNIAYDLFFIGGTGGATPEMGAINIRTGNVGIGTNTPSKALDVNGDIQFSGDLYKNDQLLDLNLWEENGNKIYYNQGNVGIGVTSPAANLHIVSDIGDTDAEFLKIQNTGTSVFGSGTTIIGKQVGGGPVIVQQAGNSSFSNQGSTLSFIQKSANNQVGLNISTFTFVNGSVKESNICAPDCALTVGAKENLNLRSQNGDIKFYANAPLIDDALLAMTINNSGQVGIGTENHIDNFTKLTVAGRIHAQEVKVTAGAGADFVFGKDYDLPGIAETADFIKANQHLPGIPSAKEMQQNGINLGEMQIKLLQTVEELTLHIIELNKRIEILESENLEIKSKNN